jgi:OOP family OmpA-OmpF porin
MLPGGDHDAHVYTLDDAGNALMSNTVHLSANGEAPAADREQGAAGDGDGDRVADEVDQCPGTPADVAVDAHGCPRAGETLLTLTGVTFENNKAELKPESAEVLDRAIETLERSPGLGIVIEGHTDDRGDADYNLELSRQRAESVRRYFIDHGLPEERLEAVGKGETEPLVPNDNEQARRKNRRVELVVK